MKKRRKISLKKEMATRNMQSIVNNYHFNLPQKQKNAILSKH